MNATQRRKVEQLVRQRAKQKLIDLAGTAITEIGSLKVEEPVPPPKVQKLINEWNVLENQREQLAKKRTKIERSLERAKYRNTYASQGWVSYDTKPKTGYDLRAQLLRATRTSLNSYGDPKADTPDAIYDLTNLDQFRSHDEVRGLDQYVKDLIERINTIHHFVDDTLLVELYLEDVDENVLKGLMAKLDKI